MRKLGTIVSKRKINDVVGFVEVVKDITEVNNPTKPILVIGLNEAKKLKEDFCILEKELDKDLFWTFGKTEKRNDHEKDIDKFYEYILNKEIENIKYYYINFFKLRYNKIKNILNIINNENYKYIYINKNIIYIYYSNYIMGISLTVLEYLGIDKKKIFHRLKRNPKNIIQYQTPFLTDKMRKVVNNKKYIIPYFMSLQEE